MTVLPMQWSLRLFSSSIKLLNGSGVLLLKLLASPVDRTSPRALAQEIELLIAESRDGGLLEPQEQVRLHRALRLGLRTAREFMVPRARLRRDRGMTPLDDALTIVAASPYSRLPVYRGSLDNVVGMLHTKDVVTDYINDAAPLVDPRARAASRERGRSHAGGPPARPPAREPIAPGHRRRRRRSRRWTDHRGGRRRPNCSAA